MVKSHELAHDLLNDEAMKQAFGMLWTTQLDLAEKLLWIEVGGVFNQNFTLGHGAPLNNVGNLSLYFNDKQFGIVSGEEETVIEHKAEDIATQNMSLVIIKKHCVKVGNPHNKKVYVFPNSTAKRLIQENQALFDGFILVDKNTNIIIDESTVIKGDIVIALCQCDC